MNAPALNTSARPQVKVSSLQTVAHNGGWDIEAMQSLSAHLVLWVTKGQGRCTIDGVTRGYGPHTLICVPAGTMHGFEVGPRVQGFALFVPPAIGPDLPREVLQIRATDVFEQGEMTRHVEAIRTELKGRAPGFDRAVAAHVALLAIWIARRAARNEREAPARTSAAQRLVRDFTGLVEREVDAGKSVADFARALSVTPTHLSRVCRDSFGKPASEILQDRTILEAQRLLAGSDMKIQDVAEALGFSSAAYFTRLFSQRTGLAPREYRQRERRRGD